jgi:hypothetical protein
MIERLLAADAAMDRGDLETAERLFGQVAEADPRNAIAAVGLGRVAAGRDDGAGARAWFLRALEIDPEEAAARRLLDALERELAREAHAPSARATEPTAPPEVATPEAVAMPEAVAPPEAVAMPEAVAPPEAAGTPQAATPHGVPRQAPHRRSIWDRIRALLGLGKRG